MAVVIGEMLAVSAVEDIINARAHLQPAGRDPGGIDIMRRVAGGRAAPAGEYG